MPFTDIDAAREALSNPTLPPEELMSIAQSYPELRISVAQHPSAYPGLLVWLMTYGNDDVRSIIAERAIPTTTILTPPEPPPPPKPPVPSVPPVPSAPPKAAEPVEPDKWVEATGAGKMCGNCHKLLTPAGSNRLDGVIGVITGKDPTGKRVSGMDIPIAGYASKICPSCGVGNRNALIPAPKTQPSVYASLSSTPRDQHPYVQTSQYQTPGDAPNMGYAILGFLIPIVGFVLYLMLKNVKPLKAKSAGKGALVSVILAVVILLVFIIAAMS